MTKTSAQTSRTVDLVQLINQLDIRRFHFQLLALCAGVVFMDGFDAQAIGYVAPTLSQAWHLAPGAHARCIATAFAVIAYGVRFL